MHSKHLWYLAICTILLLTVTIVVIKQQALQKQHTSITLLPTLSTRINDVAKIRLQNREQILQLQKQDGSWSIVELDGYPALIDKVKQLIVWMSTLEVLAEKTSNPDLYNELGVEDPLLDNAASTLVTLTDSQGVELAALIVGKERLSKAAKNKPGQYVRKPATDLALLVSGIDILRPSAQSADWFEQVLFDISAQDVAELSLIHPNEPPILLKKHPGEQDFILQNIPDGKTSTSPVILNRFASLLQSFYVDGVLSDEQFKFPELYSVTRVTTFDGLLVTIHSARVKNKTYARFSFAHQAQKNAQNETMQADSANNDVPETSVLAKQLNEKLQGWNYQIPDFKSEILEKVRNDLIK